MTIKGTVKSGSSNITSVSVGVYNKTTGALVTGKTVSAAAKTYDLSALDKQVDFDKLTEGNYVYRVIATNSANKGKIVYAQSFAVAKDGTAAQTSASDGITVTGGTTVPANLKKGSLVNVKGTVTSASTNITSVTVGVYNAAGKMVTGKTQAVNAKTYDLSKLDYAVTFNKLELGTYTYGVYVSNGTTKNDLVVKQVFNVTADGKAPASASASTDKLALTNGTAVPATLKKGTAVIVKGTVTSASTNLTAVTAGVYDASGKQVTGKTANPAAKTYDLSKLDAAITFNTLPAGSYTYRVYATNSGNSNSLLTSQNFTVQ